MSKCIAILGANGVGKSTLADGLCKLEGGKPPQGHQQEIRIAEFKYIGDSWTVLDCPGSLEFMQQSMDALLVADAAVIVVSPDPDQAVLAAPFIRLAERSGVPHMLFVNQTYGPTLQLAERLRAFGKAGRSKVRDEFNETVSFERLIATYETVLTAR